MICVSVQEKSFGDCRAILESCEMAELRRTFAVFRSKRSSGSWRFGRT